MGSHRAVVLPIPIAEEARLLARGLKIYEYTILDEWERIRNNAFGVPLDGCEPTRHGPISGDR
jgi:hypothetical protein